MGVYQRLQSFFNFGKWPCWSNHLYPNGATDSPPPFLFCLFWGQFCSTNLSATLSAVYVFKRKKEQTRPIRKP